MRVVIVGAGTLGIQIARELVTENRDVVIIERVSDSAKGIANELDCMVQEGDGENLGTLTEAGVSEADWFLALTGSDESNIVACGLVAENFSKPKTIARVRSEYFGSFHNSRRRILGVDHILNPETETAEAISRIIFRGMSASTIDVREAGIQLRKIGAQDDARLVGKTLQEIRAEIGTEFIIPAVVREGELIPPTGQFEIRADDKVYILGEPGELDRMFGRGSRSTLRLRHLTIFGGGLLCRRVLKEIGVPSPEEKLSARRLGSGLEMTALSLLGNPVIKVIDENRENAKAISREFPDVEVVSRNFSDELLIEEEGIGHSDIVLNLTSSQSENLVNALVAKHAGAKHVLAVVFNDLYMRLEGLVDIDALVNLKSVVAGAILDLLRKAQIRRLHSFVEGNYELVELSIGSTFEKAGSKVKDLGLPKGVLVAFVIHEGTTIIPTGDTVIHPHNIIGLILPKGQISRLETFFSA